MPPDGHRSEGTLSLSEVPYVRGQPFWLLFRRLEKVTRRKGGTLSSRYRSNGYAPTPPPPPHTHARTAKRHDLLILLIIQKAKSKDRSLVPLDSSYSRRVT